MNEIMAELKKYTLQIIGAFLLAFAWISEVYYQEAGVCFATLAVVGVIDGYTGIKNKRTISMWIQYQFKRRYDIGIAIGMFILTCLAITNVFNFGREWVAFRWYDVALLCACHLIKGHLFLPMRERSH